MAARPALAALQLPSRTVAVGSICGTHVAIRRARRSLMRRYYCGPDLGDRCDGVRDQQPSAGPGRQSGVSPAVPSPARYDDTVSAQPAERADPLDPQRILDQLPADERGSFLDQYREAVENARDPAGWKQLRRVLRLWRFHVDAVGDPGYREALDAARGPVSSGMPLEDAVRVCRPAS